MRERTLRMTRTLLLSASLLAGGAALAAVPRTEARDPVRGVSFHSIQISDVAIRSLRVIEGDFSAADRLAVGLSALVFDGSDGVEEYIFWLRHEGRRWLDFGAGDPVSIEVADEPLGIEPLRALQPFVGPSSRLFEKIEFRLDETVLDRLTDGSEVRIRLRSGNGTVEAVLSAQDIEEIRAFRASLARQPD
jgi:hypothetical protein